VNSSRERGKNDGRPEQERRFARSRLHCVLYHAWVRRGVGAGCARPQGGAASPLLRHTGGEAGEFRKSFSVSLDLDERQRERRFSEPEPVDVTRAVDTSTKGG